jgi:profilin
MSWQDLINDVLISSGDVSQGAIFGLDGEEFATTDGFHLPNSEIQEIVAIFTNPYPANIQVNGINYNTLHRDDESIKGRKGSDGVFIFKTTMVFVIATCEGNIHYEGCYQAVKTLADYVSTIEVNQS